MTAINDQRKLRIGFLSALETDGRGFVGGLLITNALGRPLEFQCTTPVKPERTQEILYGRTLRPWLLGELIGKTLYDRVAIKPDLIVTAEPDMLSLRDCIECPVVCTSAAPSEEPEQNESLPRMAGRRLRFHNGHSTDAEFIEQHAHIVPGQADLEEPLERVREALQETVRTVMGR